MDAEQGGERAGRRPRAPRAGDPATVDRDADRFGTEGAEVPGAQRAVVAEAAFRHAPDRPTVASTRRPGSRWRGPGESEIELENSRPPASSGAQMLPTVLAANGWKRPSSLNAPSRPSTPIRPSTSRPACRQPSPRVVLTIRSPHGRPSPGIRRREVEHAVGAGNDHARAAVGRAVLVTGRAHGRPDGNHAGRGQGSGPGDGERDRHAREQPAPPTATRAAGGHRRQLALELRDQGHCSPFRSAARPRLTRWRTTAFFRALELARDRRVVGLVQHAPADGLALVGGKIGEPGLHDGLLGLEHDTFDGAYGGLAHRERPEPEPRTRSSLDPPATPAGLHHVARDPQQPGAGAARFRPERRPRLIGAGEGLRGGVDGQLGVAHQRAHERHHRALVAAVEGGERGGIAVRAREQLVIGHPAPFWHGAAPL